jgi:CBS domain-containing protein
MLVGMWMSRDIVTVSASDALTVAARLMAQRRIRHLPVIGAEGRPIGMLSATDVFHAAPLRVNPFSVAGLDPMPASGDRLLLVADVMSTNLLTTTADSPIECAAAAMHDRKIGTLPVVRHGELIGLITESDILRAFTEILTIRCQGARVTFDISDGEDVIPLLAGLTAKHKLRLVNLFSLRLQERSFCIARIAGVSIDAMLEDLWKTGYRVESVVRS